MIDNVFNREIQKKFTFDKEIASVFDNMIERSVPYYYDNIALIAKLISKWDLQSIYDLGCSTGNLLLRLCEFENLACKKMVGIDNSMPMLEIAMMKAKAYGVNIEFINGDILDFDYVCDCVILNYTLQFVRPIKRLELLSRIFRCLNSNGVLVLSEKLSCNNEFLDKEFIDIYHEFKQANGYSKTEISKKREALENILIPYTQEENLNLLREAGFSSVEVVFRWVNFATFVAIKA